MNPLRSATFAATSSFVLWMVPMGARADGESVIEATVTDLRSDSGKLQCSIYAGEDGFPSKPEKAAGVASSEIHDHRAVCRFNLPAGSYAIAVFHDENGNGKMDRNWIGIPAEGVGASNNARGKMGPPKYKDASFNHAGGSTKLSFKVVYR